MEAKTSVFDPVFEALCERMGILDHELMPVLREHMQLHNSSVSSANAAVKLCQGLAESALMSERIAVGTLKQIAAFAPPTLARYENAVNIICDMQHIARSALSRVEQTGKRDE